MLWEILQEIKMMGYPYEGIGCGLEDAGITDRYGAAAYGFEEARDRIIDIIYSHGSEGWTHCSEPYRHEKDIGENYKPQIMGKFLRVE